MLVTNYYCSHYLNTYSLLLDTNKVASNFNDYFINVSQKLLKNLRKTNNQFQDYLKNPSEHSLFLKHRTRSSTRTTEESPH